MVEEGPGIQDCISSMVSTLESDLVSNCTVDDEFSRLAVLFLSAARQAEDWSLDCEDVSLADRRRDSL